MNFSEYFLQENSFRYIDAIRSCDQPWSFLSKLNNHILQLTSNDGRKGLKQLDNRAHIETITNPSGKAVETSINVHRTVILTEDFSNGENISIGKGTLLEAGAIIKAPTVIGLDCEIRQGAYIRGGALIGDSVVIGHVTEVKNGVIMDRSAAGHFAYVGDSILGSNVNLGAGTKIANLQFRTKSEIDDGNIKSVLIQSDEGVIDTGISKLGAVIGDYTEIGCNTVTAPGAIVGAHCWIYPNTTLPKGFYQPESVLRNSSSSGIKRSRRNLL